MPRLCSICARGGSKGVRNKNIREILGKPLIAYSIDQAKRSGLFDYIAVSSDSEEILSAARQWGADILINRPEILATDNAAKLPVIQHCLMEAERLMGVEFDVVVDLDATAPLRTVNDIIASVKLLEESNISNVITGMPARRSPYFNLVEQDELGRVHLSKTLEVPVLRRQDAPKCFDMNASIYVWKRNVLLERTTLFLHDTGIYVMPEERSIDIDSELDFRIVEWIINAREGVSDE
ncbi:CMP-N,N'-diacetyllegionaminic acid synthase [Paenibacillus plantiphilus]|uniref:CMP-N,N'-diacetyllegionaminic acid synthase n=1 Tax=Paenibacillus plantiphilus TaxID=2905650 RepID=A0ABN8FYV5_9BACL|nr:acylneuraminate cytidylyltransferase family protein [Paenibacillus plantiphilus]CAH1192877.1 CMP-N,N'-diacetyllegionaminic acid synthase [Paenibacillus plantiphilus]